MRTHGVGCIGCDRSVPIDCRNHSASNRPEPERWPRIGAQRPLSFQRAADPRGNCYEDSEGERLDAHPWYIDEPEGRAVGCVEVGAKSGSRGRWSRVGGRAAPGDRLECV